MTEQKKIFTYWQFALVATILFILSVIIPIFFPIWLALVLIFLGFNLLKPFIKPATALDIFLVPFFILISIGLIIGLAVNAFNQISWWGIIVLAIITALFTEVKNMFKWLPQPVIKKQIREQVIHKKIDFVSTILGIIIVIIAVLITGSLINGAIIGLILALFISWT